MIEIGVMGLPREAFTGSVDGKSHPKELDLVALNPDLLKAGAKAVPG